MGQDTCARAPMACARLDRFLDAEVGRVRPPPERVEHQHVDAPELLAAPSREPPSHRSRTPSGPIRKPNTPRAAVLEARAGSTGSPAIVDWLAPGSSGRSVEPRLRGSRRTARRRRRRCTRNASRSVVDASPRAVARAAAGPLPEREDPQIVDAVDVIGVLVGVEHRVDAVDALAAAAAAGARAACRSGAWRRRTAISAAVRRAPVARVGRSGRRRSRTRSAARRTRCRCRAG